MKFIIYPKYNYEGWYYLVITLCFHYLIIGNVNECSMGIGFWIIFRNILGVNDKTINFCFYISHENCVKSFLNIVY